MSKKLTKPIRHKFHELLYGPQTDHKFRDHSGEAALFFRRAIIAFIIVMLMLLGLIGNILKLQVAHYDDYQTRSNGNRIKLIPIPPNRGLIFDRNGIPIAINRTSYQLEANPNHLKELQASFDDLRTLVGLTDEDITNFNKARQNSPRFSSIPLKSNLTEDQINHFIVNQYRYPYLQIKGIPNRYYPYGSTLTHVLGYVSKINDQDIKRLKEDNEFSDYAATHDIGKTGIERYYENILHGKPGYEEVEVNNRGRFVRQLSITPPQAGQNIYLTINLSLQQYIQKLLNGRRAAVVVLDPRNSDVLAMVSSPSYDPNLFVNGISNKDYQKLITDPNKPLINRATQGAYPPGSTVKPFIATAALSEKIITPLQKLHAGSSWTLPNTEKRYRDWRRIGHGNINVEQALEASADTFFYQVIYELGIDRLHKWMSAFGYGSPSGIDLKEEQNGILPSRTWKMARYKQPWYQGDTIPVGIGQGYWTATPIQQAKALTILINNGKVTAPHLLLKTEQGDHVNRYTPLPSQHINGVPDNIWQIPKKGMYDVLYGIRGSARTVFRNTPYKAAGKSGTSQVFTLKHNEIYREDQLPEHLRDHALFIAYAPYDHPRFAISIILENGGGGSSQAGSVAKKILDYIFLNDDSLTLPAAAKNNLRGD